MKLTRAQRETLLVLNGGGGRVQASKRMSSLGPPRNVNYLAGASLQRLGLARCIARTEWASVTECTDLYELTDEGRALVATMLRRSPTARAPAG